MRDTIYIHDRQGIVRLLDVNGDGEADRYENFTMSHSRTARVAQQTMRIFVDPIVDPASEVVRGFEPGMPTFRGVLSDAEVESLIRYIASLGGRARR
ncbi:MAG: cytochrome c [bacterium]